MHLLQTYVKAEARYPLGLNSYYFDQTSTFFPHNLSRCVYNSLSIYFTLYNKIILRTTYKKCNLVKEVNKLVKFFSFLLLVASFNSNAKSYHNLPEDLLSMAVSSDVIFDEDFDYVRIGDTINLLQNDLIANSSKYKKQLVDLVVVNKTSHQMVLMKNGNEVRRFWIALSDRPVGHKQFEGDKKTPEGTYTLDYVKQRSNYYKAIHISYPNSNDIANARKYGRKPGGMIMIHGQPPSRSDYHENVQRTDWTNGCIALLNPDIDIFLSLVDVGTPITINP